MQENNPAGLRTKKLKWRAEKPNQNIGKLILDRKDQVQLRTGQNAIGPIRVIGPVESVNIVGETVVDTQSQVFEPAW